MKKDISFVSTSMTLHLTKEQYKDLEKIINAHSKKNKWKSQKKKMEEGYSVTILKSNPSPKQAFTFIQNIQKMLDDIDETIGKEAYPDNYTSIQYYDLGEKEMIAFSRYSGMMILNIMSDDALRLEKENQQLTSEIFGQYVLGDDGRFLNVRMSEMGGERASLFETIKDFFKKGN